MKPIIHIESVLLQKIRHYVDIHDKEISGLGKISVETGGIIRIVSAAILDPFGTAIYTEIPAELFAKKDYDDRDLPGVLRFHWHSHVNMDAFWSSVDIKLINDFAQGGWCLAMVLNKRGDMRFAVAGTVPVPFFVDELPVKILDDSALISAWNAELVLAKAVMEKHQASKAAFPLISPSNWPKSAINNDKEFRRGLARDRLLDLAWEKLENLEILSEREQALLTSEHGDEWRQYYPYD